MTIFKQESEKTEHAIVLQSWTKAKALAHSEIYGSRWIKFQTGQHIQGNNNQSTYRQSSTLLVRLDVYCGGK
jgi:hypothetical protein